MRFAFRSPDLTIDSRWNVPAWVPCTKDMFHLLRGHDPWASWRRGVTLQTPLPPRMCGTVARNGQTSLPIVLASSRMIGEWKLQGRCRLADVHLASLELGMKSFFVHICILFGKMNDGFPTLPEKKLVRSIASKHPDLTSYLPYDGSHAFATLAFQGWAPYLNKSPSICSKHLGQLRLICFGDKGLLVDDPIAPLGAKIPWSTLGRMLSIFFGSENSTGCKVAPYHIFHLDESAIVDSKVSWEVIC